MRGNRRIIIQLIADAIIPLLGFFLWNWSLYFIVLYYLLDCISNETLMHIKTAKILKNNKVDKLFWKKNGSLSFLLLCSWILLLHLFIPVKKDFISEIIDFLNYEDLGIKQGYILLPLFMLTAYQRYKTEFILPKKHLTLSVPEVWKPHLLASLFLLACVGIIFAVSRVVMVDETVYTLGTIMLFAGHTLFKES